MAFDEQTTEEIGLYGSLTPSDAQLFVVDIMTAAMKTLEPTVDGYRMRPGDHRGAVLALALQLQEFLELKE
ncbi:MAG: hypothetical protein AAFR28_18270, partial [Pseudomonadota bacterium]